MARQPDGARAWWLATISLVLAANVMFSRVLVVDSFYDLYAGRFIVEHGIPRANLTTVAAHGAPWIDQQWLAQVIYYGAWKAGGYPAMAALSAALVTAGFALLALVMLRRGIPPTRMLAWTAAAFLACLGNTNVRAQSFGYPLFAITIWLILDDDRADRAAPGRLSRRTWLLVPVLVLWANTHGSALLGAGIVVLYAGYKIARALRRGDYRGVLGYVALGLVGAATVICTPYGLRTIGYYQGFVGKPELTHNIVEWAPPSLGNPLCWAFFALLLAVAASLVVAWRRGTRPDPLLAGLTVVLLAFALTAVRDQAWFGLGASVLAADALARGSAGRVPALSAEFRRIVAGLLAALAVASLVTLAATPDGQFTSQLPIRSIDVAVAIAARNPALRVLGDEFTSTPMMWLHPAMLGRVGFDVRFDLYSRAQLRSYFDFLQVSGRAWQRVTRGYGLIAITDQHPQAVSALRRLRGWRVAYSGSGIVLVRMRSPTARTR